MKKLKNSGFFFFIIWTALTIFYSGRTNAQSETIDPSGHQNNNNFVVGRVACINSSNPSDTTYVSGGKVKLLKLTRPLDVAAVDSANITSDGYYTLYGIPQGEYYIVAYPGDKKEDFMITFYPSGQLYNTASRLLLTGGQLKICNIYSVSMNSVGGGMPVNGEVADSTNHNFKLRNSIILAKSENEYRGFAMTDNFGNYLINSIMPGSYSLTATRFGYINQTKNVDISSASTVNFYLSRDTSTVSVSNNSSIVKNFKLYQNYPNPFNPSTEIVFSLEKGMNVKLNVYSLEGKFIREIVNSFKPAGEYKFKFIAENLSSGIYNYVLETENGQRESRLMVFTK